MYSVRRICAFTLATVLWAIAASAVEQGDVAPVWTAPDFAGQPVAFPQVGDGKPMVVLFWATWCPYCKAFMPYLKTIQSDYASTGVKVVAINTKERGQGDPKAYVEGLGFSLIGIPDGDRIGEVYDVQFIPGLFIVDGAGTIAYRRGWTDLPAGSTVAQLWDRQVREVLDRLVR